MGEHLQACFSCPDLAIWGRRFTWVVAGLWLISRVLKKSVRTVLPVFSLLWRWRGFSEVLTLLCLLTPFADRPPLNTALAGTHGPAPTLPHGPLGGVRSLPLAWEARMRSLRGVPAPRESLPWSEHICSSSKAGLRSASYTHSPAISEKSGSGNLARYGS